MATFVQSILVNNVSIAADGDIVIDCPVNPLSAILLHVSPLNETSTITTYSMLAALLGAFSKVRVLHRGASVVDGSLADLAMVAMLWRGQRVWQSNCVETDNDRRSVVVPITFGRQAYDPKECFPETKKGELQLSLTADIAATGYDGLRYSVETIELPDAEPVYVEKVTTLAQTFGATGQQDVDLPIGNVIRALLLWGTTAYAGATPVPSWGQVSVLRDNRQTYYSASDWEVLRGLNGVRGVLFPADFRHIHSGTYTTTVAGDSREPEIGASLDANYALVPFDVLGDDSYSMVTEGAGRVNVRAVAETADAVRVLPIERVPVATFKD